jgi:hypothetical protein
LKTRYRRAGQIPQSDAFGLALGEQLTRPRNQDNTGKQHAQHVDLPEFLNLDHDSMPGGPSGKDEGSLQICKC